MKVSIYNKMNPSTKVESIECESVAHIGNKLVIITPYRRETVDLSIYKVVMYAYGRKE